MILRLALIGCGRHMQTTLVPYLMKLEGYEVEICIDFDEVSARRVQQMSHAKRYACTIEDVECKEIDAALIAVPGNEAYHMTRYLLHHDVACFVEKPPASTTEEVQDLLKIARSRNIYVQVGFNFRFAEAIDKFRSSLIEHSDNPFSINIEFRSKHPAGPEWGRTNPVEAWVYHNGIHALDLLRWTGGEIKQVQAEIMQTKEGKFMIVALMKHTNSSISTIKMGTLTDKFDLRLEVLTADADQFYVPHLGEVILSSYHGKVSGEVLYRTPNLDNGWGRAGYGPELKHFIRNYHLYENSSPSLLDALKATELCDAVMYSLRTNAPCRLD